ncbi:hypothetical protein [uncultured Parvimonas sp.]|uniref:hypothetical protein n=1 Tax=uncultured Parvimonas sp. TaxID=747372 RepID=UPI002804F8FF|nr:hypothetical protein [uncultured Parvimonas sp.]
MSDNIFMHTKVLENIKQLKKVWRKKEDEEESNLLIKEFVSILNNLFLFIDKFLLFIDNLGIRGDYKYTFSLNDKLRLSFMMSRTPLGRSYFIVNIDYKKKILKKLRKPLFHYSTFFTDYSHLYGHEDIHFKNEEFFIYFEDGKIIDTNCGILLSRRSCRKDFKKFLLDFKNIDIENCFCESMQNVLSELKFEITKVVLRGFNIIDLESSFRMIKTIENELEKIFKIKIKD